MMSNECKRYRLNIEVVLNLLNMHKIHANYRFIDCGCRVRFYWNDLNFLSCPFKWSTYPLPYAFHSAQHTFNVK